MWEKIIFKPKDLIFIAQAGLSRPSVAIMKRLLGDFGSLSRTWNESCGPI